MAVPQRSAVRRTSQVLTGLGALVVLCAALAGGPVALLALAGNPLPDHLPTLAEVGTALTSRDDGQLFLRALAVLGWFGWATFAFSVLVELLAAVLRRPAPRLPGMGRQQRAAAALVGSVALILAATPAAASAATLAAPQPAAAPVAVAAPAARAASPASDPAVYRVAKGDYLGEVAERYLDDFDRYREVARLNRLADPDRIHPGQLLKLPEGAVDDGARRHATGRLVVRPVAPSRPAPTPRPPAAAPHAPGTGPAATPHAPGTGAVAPGGGSGATADGSGAGMTGQPAKPKPYPSRADTPRSTVEEPAGPPPAMAAGASRATGDDEGMNRPLAISAVLAVASIVGAQIGAVLGLRRRPAARALVSGRHRKD
ncbi:LysM peptidoglycan-binding domain-containing protein [Micromonospora yasonensis]|uniref:LysM peptidoglycan-binding domain-containing protein n=1 Tax=Micromonospora yasonensis TaxID=1128667 RepID=UPI00222E586C|nr:LysM domain-containing protein [Micromonospora yasonensis]MCW3839457.1 LysM peptidoglycan-binding domain-containing protein [Micromonospora yasonensis]